MRSQMQTLHSVQISGTPMEWQDVVDAIRLAQTALIANDNVEAAEVLRRFRIVLEESGVVERIER